MDLGTVLSAAQTLFAALECSDLKEVLSMLSYESEVDGLQRTVKFLTAVLRDAETKQHLSNQEQEFISQIKDAVFDADDLMDELVTLAHQQRIEDADASSSSLLEKVSHFFSKSNPICVSYWMSQEFKEVKNKLDDIAQNIQFSFKIDPEPIRKRSRETCSYVEESQIIGRERDLENVVGKLLASSDDPKCNNNVSVLCIVGIGGLGKTALSQLVYNDTRVREAFPLKMWTCVSDEDQKVLDVKDILAKILAKVSPHKKPDKDLTMDEVQGQLREELVGKKYLLVLDDVWTEDRYQWTKLANYVNGGEKGSCILVTTRSLKTAAITGGHIHELSGLSKKNSRQLFQRTAFDSNQPNPPDDDLVKIGWKIVDGCAGVPLAIKVAGSLLYGQEKNQWLSVQQIGLANTKECVNDIMPILELSYYHLESPLRNCFSYCALFPKDFRMDKDMLIGLWMAQGYIIPLKGQSIEDAGEEYFSILLKRCFFQDTKKNKYGEIESCKVHDLMHDIAKKVSRKEIYASSSICGHVDNNIRHLSILNTSQFEKYCSLGNIRSLLSFIKYDNHLLGDTIIKSFKRLRVLDLSDKNIEHLSDSIGELLHLRYIDLSRNWWIEALPKSFTKLCNLQVLILNDSFYLKELPKDLSRLVKLRVLDIGDCNMLRCMPRGMGKLTSLHTLKGVYRVGVEGRCKSWKQWLDALEDLKSLINLKGELHIQFQWPFLDAKNDDVMEDQLRNGLYLRSMEHLDFLVLDSMGANDGEIDEEYDEETVQGILMGIMRVMEALQPHSNLKWLTVQNYIGPEMFGWITLLPNLVKLELESCDELKYLPWLGTLCHLKYMCLKYLSELEYMIIEEESSELATTSSSTAQKLPFYPSLEVLQLWKLPKWKGWRRGIELEESSSNNNKSRDSIIIPQAVMQLSLPQLKKLKIWDCGEFTSCSLVCPMLETLHLQRFNEGLQIERTETNDEKPSEEAAIENPASNTHHVPNLRKLKVDNGAWLDSMPMETLNSLQKLIISGDRQMAELPNNLQYLSSLQTLRIERCKNLKAMPNWMPKLTSLKQLDCWGCSKSLWSRCKKDPPGEDWPLIQHISTINFHLV